MPRASRADVARLANVAPSTVSNVLNGRAQGLRIAEATVARVRQAAQELGYVPQASARALRGASSHTLGLLLSPLPVEVFVPVLHDVAAAAIATAQNREHLIVPFADPGGPGTDIDFVERALADVDLAGVVGELSPRNVVAGERLRQMDVPVVWMSFGAPAELPPGVGHVVLRQAAGVRAVLERLEIADDEEVAIVHGPNHRPERLAVAKELFGDAVHIVQSDQWLPQAGAKSMREIIRNLPRVRTVFCADDYIAYGALHALQEGGFRAPDDYSIVGFGGFDSGAHLGGQLTSVRWPVREVTARAINTLVDHLSGKNPLMSAQAAPIVAELECEPIFGTTARLKPSEELTGA